MSYIKNNNRTPLMFDGPTPVNMAPAMAGCCSPFGDEIEMDPDFAGKGADPNVIGQPPPPAGNVIGALASGIANMFGGAASAITKPFASSSTPIGAKTVGTAANAHNKLSDKILAAGPLLLLIGAGAYFAFKKRS